MGLRDNIKQIKFILDKMFDRLDVEAELKISDVLNIV